MMIGLNIDMWQYDCLFIGIGAVIGAFDGCDENGPSTTGVRCRQPTLFARGLGRQNPSTADELPTAGIDM